MALKTKCMLKSNLIALLRTPLTLKKFSDLLLTLKTSNLDNSYEKATSIK